MKRFTQKFFLLAMGMLLSVGASAQSTVTHRYPEVTYYINNNEYVLPAWDVQMGTTYQFRIQALDPVPESTETHIRGKIVGRRAFTTQKVNNGDYLFSATPSNVSIVPFNGTQPQSKSINSWTYGDVFGIKGTDEGGLMEPGASDAGKPIFGSNSAIYIATDLEIPSVWTAGSTAQQWAGVTFDIVEIGVAAFRNFNQDTHSILDLSGTLTIPASVEVIEHDAFRHGNFKKVEFAEGSHLTTIGKAAFAGCVKMEEITIPASVGMIEGMAFGGCNVLQKVTFEGSAIPTFTEVVEEPKYTEKNGYTGPYNIFQNSQRFIDNGVSKNVDPTKCIIEVPLGTAKSYLDNNPDPDEHLDLARFPMMSKFPMTISVNEEDLDLNIISYCSDVPFTFKQYDTATQGWNTGDVKAYYIEKSGVDVVNGKVTLTEIKEDKKIPSNPLGVVLSGTGGQTYDIFYPNNLLDELSVANNCFVGVITKTWIEVVEGNLYYVLSNGKFIPVKKSGNLSANRAYLKYEPGEDDDITVPIVGSKELSVSLPEDTGISNHEVERGVQYDAWYTLQGIQVENPQKGIFIKNGKKFVIK